MRTRSPSFVLRSAPLVAALACALAPQAANALSFPVSSTPSIASGDVLTVGSLANAITLANATCVLGNTVDLPTGPFTIAPATAMPLITCPGLTINGNGSTLDGSSVEGTPYGGTACDGTFVGGVVPFTVNNLTVTNFYYSYIGAICGPVTADGNTVEYNNIGITVEAGLAHITNNKFGGNGTGIDMESGGAIISGNYIGTLDGTNPLANYNGIELWGEASTITNNVISGNYDGEGSGSGIYVDDFGGSSITGNKIGTDASGTTALGNGAGIVSHSQVTVSNNVISGNYNDGVDFYTDGTLSGNKIGTDAAGTYAIPNDVGFYGGFLSSATSISGNVISGNSYAGIYLAYSGGTTISNNMIGTNLTGTAAIPNDVGFYGGYLSSGVTLSNNVISGNTSEGVFYVYSSGVAVLSNKVGTNASGTSAIANSEGVSANCSDSPVISGNVISGNSYAGVSLYGMYGTYGGSIENVVSNYIGVASDGVTSLGNASYGVLLDTGSWCGNTETDDTLTLGNAIANNGTGIAMRAGTGNAFSQNLVFANATKNIDLVPGGSASPLLNDPGDPDSGPNDGQNYPIVNSVMHASGQTQVSYTLDSAPGDYQVEFFSNDTVGIPAGQHYVGSATVTLSSGPLTSVNTFPGLLDNFSMTATLLAGTVLTDTSELSPIVSFVGTPAVHVAPSAVSFGPVAIGGSSAPHTITVTSSGTAPYSLASLGNSATCDGGPICSSGGFICSTTCLPPHSYAPGASCSITTTFAPTFIGTGQTTSIYVCDSSGTGTLALLTGDGVVPSPINIQPPAWDFGTVTIGQSSSDQIFAIANPGSVPVTIGTVSTTGDFVIADSNCASVIAAGSQCTADVHFTPTLTGARSGTLVVPYSGPILDLSTPAAKVVSEGSFATSLLSGTGTSQPALDVPALVDFGSYSLGAPGLVRTATITNTGTAVVHISSITTTAPFTVSNDCTQALNPGDACHVTIGFSSTVPGPFTGSVSVASDAPGGLRTIALTALAQGVAAPVIHIAPTTIGFGERLIGTQSPTQRITIANDGGAGAALGGIGTSNLDFLVASTTCGLTLAPQTTCFADVVMRPVGLGQRLGQFVVNSNAAGSPQAVGLSGLGCLPFDISNNRLGASTRCGP